MTGTDVSSDGTTAIAGVEIEPLRCLVDKRGWFMKALMAQDLPVAQREFGEIYASTSEQGAVRGNHLHRKTTEWFIPLHGLGELWLVGLDGGRMRIVFDRSNPVRVKIPPGVAHAFRGLAGHTLTLLAYSDRPYDPSDNDTFPVPVL